jgi:hypothetical protein
MEVARLTLIDRLEIDARLKLVDVSPDPMPARLVAPIRPMADAPPNPAEPLIPGRVPTPKAFRPMASPLLVIPGRPMLDIPPNRPAELMGARPPAPKEFRAIPIPAPFIPIPGRPI